MVTKENELKTNIKEKNQKYRLKAVF